MNNPYYKFLKRDVKIALIAFISIVTVNVGMSVISNIISALDGSSIEPIRFFSQASMLAYIMCMAYGINCTVKTFGGVISIRGDRLGFLKAIALWSITIAIFASLFSVFFEIGCKVLMELITKRKVYVISGISWISIDNLEFKVADVSLMWFIKSIITRTLTNTLMISLGYMLGSISYRLKVRTNVILFIGVPILFAGYISAQAFKNQDVVLDWVMKFIGATLYVIQNPVILISLQIIGIIVFALIGTKFLIKAPIKDYAHDLI